jgi:hypothetical protein
MRNQMIAHQTLPIKKDIDLYESFDFDDQYDQKAEAPCVEG